MTRIKSKQSGHTLLEVILSVAIISLTTMISFAEKSRELDFQAAKISGKYLLEYSLATSKWLSDNPGAPNSLKTGSSWLKATTCPGGTSTKSYLPCDFPSATLTEPLHNGSLAIETQISTSGISPNLITTARTITSRYENNLQTDASLAGVAALYVAAGQTTNGNFVLSGGSVKSDPLTARIEIIASNNTSTDPWLRTDGSNTMNSNINFGVTALARDINNVFNVRSMAGTSLNLIGGSGALGGGTVQIDGAQTTTGSITASNLAGDANAIVANSGNIRAQNGDVISRNVIASVNVTAGNGLFARTFYDSDNTSYYINPENASMLNSGTFAGRITANEFIQLNRVVSVGAGCAPNGLLARDATGMTLSCISGLWAAGGGATFTQYISGSCQSPGSWVVNNCLLANSTWATCNLRGAYAIGSDESGYIYRDGSGNWYLRAVRAGWPGVFYWHCQK